MPSLENFINGSGPAQEPGDRAGMALATRRRSRTRRLLAGLALWTSWVMTGCGESGPGITPEQKEKQGVVQDKMKDFMKKGAGAKLPNMPR
jgi:hypothetical protein